MGGCNKEAPFTPKYPLNIPLDSALTTRVDASKVFQTIDAFGSSGAFSTLDYVGKYWSDKNKEGIAELLFSSEIKDGKPSGIGLSHWRTIIGGGTAEQGEDSGIDLENNATRVNECYLNPDGTYDWNKSSGQRYFMRKAKEYGCNSFTLFSCTPPIQYTKNGKGWSNSGNSGNLKEQHYEDFAVFLTTVAKHFVDEGYNVEYISPVNEPEYNWGPGSNQEGSGWKNTEVAKLARLMDKIMTSSGLDNTKILISEAAKWFYLYQATVDGRGNVLNAYFNQTSTDTYIGNLSHLAPIIGGHSYFTDKTWDELKSVRTQVYNNAKKYNLKVYQTEWSMLDTGYEDCPDFTKATYMDLSLSMAKVLHHDLTTANVSSWCYWTTAETERWGHLNRFYLVRLIPGGGDYGDMKENGTYMAGKNLWVLGNYSLFVRPGYQRIELNIPDTDNTFFGSAYLSPNKDKLVVVYTNCTKKSIKVTTEFTGLENEIGDYEQYVTSATTDLKRSPSYEKSIVPPRAVVTMIYNLK